MSSHRTDPQAHLQTAPPHAAIISSRRPAALGRREQLLVVLASVLVLTGALYPTLERNASRTRVEQALLADNLAQAEQDLGRLLIADPRSPQTWLLSAIAHRRADRISEFRASLARADEYGLGASESAFQGKLLETQQGQIDKPRELQLLTDAQQFSSDFVAGQTYEAIARGYMATYRLKEAWACLEHWQQWRADAISAHFLKAEIMLRIGSVTNAIEEYQKILRMNPLSQSAQEKLAINLLSHNQVDEAAEILQKLSVAAADQPQVWIELAEAERRLGNNDQTSTALSRATELGLDTRQRARASAIRGQLELVEQHPEQAVAYLLVTVELTPEDAAAHHALGTALAFLGQEAAATEHRQTAQRLRESYAEVLSLTQQVIDAPNDPDLRTRIGQGLLVQGLTKDAVGWIKTALICDPNFQPAKQLLHALGVDAAPTASARLSNTTP